MKVHELGPVTAKAPVDTSHGIMLCITLPFMDRGCSTSSYGRVTWSACNHDESCPMSGTECNTVDRAWLGRAGDRIAAFQDSVGGPKKRFSTMIRQAGGGSSGQASQ